jgi:ADP-ribose pyrophosphatase YjhB (NUDIX family)
MAKSIEIIARGLLEYRGHVLLCQSVAGGYCYLPGGHVEFKEGARAAVERELVEECGLKVRAGEMVLVTEGTFKAGGRRHHELNLVFHVEQRGAWKGATPPPITSLEEEIHFLWVPVSELGAMDVRPDAIREWLLERGIRGMGGAEGGTGEGRKGSSVGGRSGGRSGDEGGDAGGAVAAFRSAMQSSVGSEFRR